MKGKGSFQRTFKDISVRSFAVGLHAITVTLCHTLAIPMCRLAWSCLDRPFTAKIKLKNMERAMVKHLRVTTLPITVWKGRDFRPMKSNWPIKKNRSATKISKKMLRHQKKMKRQQNFEHLMQQHNRELLCEESNEIKNGKFSYEKEEIGCFSNKITNNFSKTLINESESEGTTEEAVEDDLEVEDASELQRLVAPKRNPEGWNKGGDLSLEMCLGSFTKQDKLEAKTGNGYACSKCCKKGKGQKVDAMKQMLILRAPKILVFHLKRLRPFKKATVHISFPETFCLDPFVWGPTRGLEYSLYCTIVHLGCAKAGHYIAYTKGGNGWVRASDEDCSPCSVDEVLRSQAYMLFYKRIDN
mmetsp:Transcript_14244/g.21078  ORF Transcript_14244/g.21078 Transcript_14244/m.21078 type:complete len:357 (+) Transcript_14244:574-1644(+)